MCRGIILHNKKKNVSHSTQVRNLLFRFHLQESLFTNQTKNLFYKCNNNECIANIFSTDLLPSFNRAAKDFTLCEVLSVLNTSVNSTICTFSNIPKYGQSSSVILVCKRWPLKGLPETDSHFAQRKLNLLKSSSLQYLHFC